MPTMVLEGPRIDPIVGVVLTLESKRGVKPLCGVARQARAEWSKGQRGKAHRDANKQAKDE